MSTLATDRWGAGLPRPPGPHAAAAAAGLPDADSAEATPINGSHSVHRVSAGGRNMIVKVPGMDALEVGRTLAAEAFAYRLASWRPGLASVMPQVHLVDERRQVVVLEAADVRSTGRELISRAELPNQRASAALGRALARVHLATLGVPIPFPASAGVLDLTRDPPPRITLTRAKDVALSLSVDSTLGPALTHARSLWGTRCLVHGDVKWDNCLVDLTTTPPVVRLIDWELSGLGDPAWDLAAALAASTASEAEGGRSGDADRAALVSAYFADGGPADPARVAVYWPARLVHLALECAEAGADLESAVLLDRARLMVGDADRLAGMMVRWAQHSRPG